MHIDGLLIATDRRVVVAHSLEKVASAEDAPWLLRKESQDLKLGWSEGNLLPRTAYSPALKVNQEFVGADDPPAERVREVAVCPSQLGLHTAEQFSDAEGLRHIVIRAELKPEDRIHLFVSRREDDHGCL